MKPAADNNLNAIAVFTDDEVYSAAILPLKAALERIIDTPQSETVFTLEHFPWEELQVNTGSANIILLGSLDGGGAVSRFVDDMLDEGARKGVTEGDFWIFTKRDPWRRNQLLCVIIAETPAQVSQKIREGATELFNTMNESVLKRIEASLYSVNENTALEREIREKHGFQLRIQHDYTLVAEDADNRFIRLRRFFPDRWLTISWIKADSVTDSLMIAERKRLGKLFADPVRLYPDYNRFWRAENAYPFDLIMRGLWATEGPTGGGPFFISAVMSPSENLVYFIDGAVFAPDREKIPLLQQLEVMARTFKVP